ncbi:FecR domain-containing protein [Chitinophaga defluvii]|uniref:FecR domain-containing protein n=1 Tax=Chitinophaga defluvii TaxID=3163343 RepID=A0ABV2TB20_9BACT
MPEERIHYLVERFFHQSCTEEEKAELARWIDQSASDAALREVLERAWEQYEPDTVMPDATSAAVLARVFQTAAGEEAAPVVTPAAPVRKMNRWPLWRAAAVILLLAGGGIYFWLSQLPVKVPGKNMAQVQQELLPGGNKAVLTLADGTAITLDSAQNGALALQGGTQVAKLANGQLAYTGGHTATKEVVYNKISIPRGGQYQITLPDGTKVWLNAASSLRFPSAFTGKLREVELTGEAYFEVAQAVQQPFQVKVKDMKIAVLGTQFNVNAYDDEATINTTLVSGSVNVIKGAATRMLRPGQQAQLTAQGDWEVSDRTDMDAILAWKNGRFQFDGTPIAQVMRQISRWYNVDVVYRGATIQQHFNGGISRDVPLSKVFKMLEATGAVHCSVENGQVIVQP